MDRDELNEFADAEMEDPFDPPRRRQRTPAFTLVHQLLTRDEILDMVPRPAAIVRDVWLQVLVRQVEAETLRRAARLARELEVLLPHSGIVREAVAVALDERAQAAAEHLPTRIRDARA